MFAAMKRAESVLPKWWPAETAVELIEQADAIAKRCEALRIRMGGRKPTRHELLLRNAEGKELNGRWIYAESKRIEITLISVKGKLASLAIRKDKGISQSVDEAALIVREADRLKRITEQIVDLEGFKDVVPPQRQ